MNVILIYPGKLEASSSLYPPLGIGYIASYLESHGVRVMVKDLTFEKLDIQSSGDTNVYGIYTTTPLYRRAADVAAKIRQMDKNATIVYGGPHPTVLPEATLRDGADIVVVGEAEETFLELVKSIEKNLPLSGVKGIVFRMAERVVHTPARPFIQDIDALPFPDQSKFPIDKYFETKQFRELSIITSRGCPMNCTFCQPTLRKLFGDKVRYRSAENIVKEMEYLIKKFRVTMITFSDDTFCADEERVVNVCRLILKKKINILWRCQTRVGLRKETLRIMKRAGCFMMALGVESGSQKTLNSLRKGITISQVIKTFSLCKEVGILTHAFFMVGIPGEHSIDETKELIRKIKPFNIFASITTPYPGTYLYDRAKEQNLLRNAPWDKFSHIADEPILKMRRLSKKKVLAMKQELLSFHIREGSSRFSDIFGCLKDFILIRKVISICPNNIRILSDIATLGVRSLKSSHTMLTNPVKIKA